MFGLSGTAIAGLVGGAASLGGALISSNAAGNAADAQAQSVADSNALQKQEYDQTRTDNQPALAARNASLLKLEELLGIGGSATTPGYGSWGKMITPADVQASPGYQFQLAQGQKTLENSAAARGGLYSGATLKALQQYGTDYATTKTNDVINQNLTQRNAQYNELAGTGGLGQIGASQIASSGTNYANQAGGNLIGAGNARASAYNSSGAAFGSAFNQAAAGLYGSNLLGGTPNYNGSSGINGGSYVPTSSDAGSLYGDVGYSDIRLKTNIRRIGQSSRGHNWYAWDWKTGGSSEGVIAQEVLHVPGAVREGADGMLMVDYSKV